MPEPSRYRPTPQHIQALNLAHVIYSARAEAKREIKAGLLSIPDALDAHAVQTMMVWDLLKAQRLWGPYKTAKCMATCGIGHYRLVRSLTERQRRALRDYFA